MLEPNNYEYFLNTWHHFKNMNGFNIFRSPCKPCSCPFQIIKRISIGPLQGARSEGRASPHGHS